MRKYLFLVVVLAVTAGGTLSTAVRTSTPPYAAPRQDAAVETPPEGREDELPARHADTLFTDSYVGQVVFPHRYHYEEEGMTCDECHHETNAATLHLPRDHEAYFEDFWVDCAVCHRADGETALEPQACSACHPDQPRREADQTLSAKVVIHQHCADCHDFGTGAEAAASCKYCHSGPKRAFELIMGD